MGYSVLLVAAGRRRLSAPNLLGCRWIHCRCGNKRMRRSNHLTYMDTRKCTVHPPETELESILHITVVSESLKLLCFSLSTSCSSFVTGGNLIRQFNKRERLLPEFTSSLYLLPAFQSLRRRPAPLYGENLIDVFVKQSLWLDHVSDMTDYSLHGNRGTS